MRYKSSLLICFICFLLITPSIISLAKTDTINDETDQFKPDIFRSKPRKIQPLPNEKQSLFSINEISNSHTTAKSFSQSVLPDEIYPIQRYPTLATYANTVLMLAETNINTTAPGKITATSSTTNGTTWNYYMTLSHPETAFTTPSLDYTGDPEMQAYGASLIDLKTGVQMIYCFPSLTDPLAGYQGDIPDFNRNGWFSGRMITWDPTYWSSVTDTATAGYPHGITIAPFDNFHGLTVWGGHDGTGWSYYFYCDTDQNVENPFKILWKNYLDGAVIDVECDIDLSTGWSYDLCEIINATTGIHEIYMDMLFLEPGNSAWFNDDLNYGPNWKFIDYTQPCLKAANGKVYLACIKDGDVYLHLSSNKGYTYDTIQLTNTTIDESAPEVTVLNDHIIISFVKENNLYSIISQDAGITWKQPEQINQINGIISSDTNYVCVDKDYIIWTEQRGNETLSLLKQNIKTPQFIITNITGGTNLSFDIKNIGTADAIDFPYRIEITQGWLFSERILNGSVNVAVGDDITISTDLLLGIGKPNINIRIGQTMKSVPSFLLLFYLRIKE